MRLSSLWFRLGALFLLGLLLFVGFTLWQRSPARSPLLAPLPQDPLIQVYFNHSEASRYTEPYRQQTRTGDDLEQMVIDAIATAQSSVDVAVHELSLPRITEALKERHQAGVRVRVIMENTYTTPMSSLTAQDVAQMEERERKKYSEFVQLVDLNQDGQLTAEEIAQRDPIAILQNAQVPFIDDTADGSKGSALMHHKFIVIDEQVLIVGSANLSLSDVHGDFSSPDSRGNANHLLKISSPAIAKLYAEEFALMWGDGSGGKTDSQFGVQKPYRSPQTITLTPHSSVTVQFSPTSSSRSWEVSVNGLIGRTLNQASRSIDLALFVFSDQNLVNGLEANQRKGVQIRALIDPGFIYRDYSEGLDLMGVALANKQCRYEEGNRPWQTPISTVGIPNLPEGDILHHKMGLVDGRIVITGSQNWSEVANSSNDENVLVIDNPTVAAHFQREFDRLYQNASLGVPSWLQEKAQKQQAQCRSRS